ncbi:MAG: 16S rRNA (guanine(966)-N(2))-methyltransferase RsmD [Planctomycetota bacterium]
MRIIAGKWRSRRLEYPPESITRPMPDRVKESVFNMLGCHYGCPGELPPIQVADVFSGGGSLGLEALSRGAVGCVFFEKERRALDVLSRNLDALQIGEEALVVSGDGWRKVLAWVQSDTRPMGLMFLDPPYVNSEDPSANGHVWQFLGRLTACMSEAPMVVLHHEATIRYDEVMIEPWTLLDSRKIGSNAVTFFHVVS